MMREVWFLPWLFTSSREKTDTSDSEADEDRENLSGVPWEVWACPFVCLFVLGSCCITLLLILKSVSRLEDRFSASDGWACS